MNPVHLILASTLFALTSCLNNRLQRMLLSSRCSSPFCWCRLSSYHSFITPSRARIPLDSLLSWLMLPSSTLTLHPTSNGHAYVPTASIGAYQYMRPPESGICLGRSHLQLGPRSLQEFGEPDKRAERGFCGSGLWTALAQASSTVDRRRSCKMSPIFSGTWLTDIFWVTWLPMECLRLYD